MDEPLPLSVVVVAKNEALTLARCLESVRRWSADILVVLNDTTDASESIALANGARVTHLPWQGYRDTKNAALALAQHDWVLSLDADEEVSPALRADLVAFFARGDHTRYTAARFPRKVWFLDRWITATGIPTSASVSLIAPAPAGAATSSYTKRSTAPAPSRASAAISITTRSPRSPRTSPK